VHALSEYRVIGNDFCCHSKIIMHVCDDCEVDLIQFLINSGIQMVFRLIVNNSMKVTVGFVDSLMWSTKALMSTVGLLLGEIPIGNPF
jgi:hypothetical protein